MMRSYAHAPQAQPSRRALVLVYMSCIAVPFAVATLAYLFRAALSQPQATAIQYADTNRSQARLAKAPMVSTMSLLPSAAAAELDPSPNTRQQP
jgi:heme/copper-type cytochrome/quinol oxidase subunit 3